MTSTHALTGRTRSQHEGQTRTDNVAPHIVWGPLEHPRTGTSRSKSEGGRPGRPVSSSSSYALDESVGGSSSSRSSSNQVPHERSEFNRIATGDVSFLPMSGSSSSYNDKEKSSSSHGSGTPRGPRRISSISHHREGRALHRDNETVVFHAEDKFKDGVMDPIAHEHHEVSQGQRDNQMLGSPAPSLPHQMAVTLKSFQVKTVDVALEELRTMKAFGDADVEVYNSAMAACVVARDMATTHKLFQELVLSGKENNESIRLMSMAQMQHASREQTPHHSGGECLASNDSVVGWGKTPSPSRSPEPKFNSFMEPRIATGNDGVPLVFPQERISDCVEANIGYPIASHAKTRHQSAQNSWIHEQMRGASSSNLDRTQLEAMQWGATAGPFIRPERVEASRPPGHFAAPTPQRSAATRDSAEKLQEEMLKMFGESDDDEPPQQGSLQQGSMQASDFDGATHEEFMSMIPLDEKGQPTSIGSIKHETGECKPCSFIDDGDGCRNGIFCQFCHFSQGHKVKKKKLSKGQRDRYRRLLERLTEECVQQPDTFNLEATHLPPWLQTNDRARRELGRRLEMFRQEVVAEKMRQGSAWDRNAALSRGTASLMGMINRAPLTL